MSAVDLLLQAPSQRGMSDTETRAVECSTKHESEAHVMLAEIADFLASNGLVFRGFTLDPEVVADFLDGTPAPKSPGTLAEWAAYEALHPRTFDGMYRFWVERGN